VWCLYPNPTSVLARTSAQTSCHEDALPRKLARGSRLTVEDDPRLEGVRHGEVLLDLHLVAVVPSVGFTVGRGCQGGHLVAVVPSVGFNVGRGCQGGVRRERIVICGFWILIQSSVLIATTHMLYSVSRGAFHCHTHLVLRRDHRCRPVKLVYTFQYSKVLLNPGRVTGDSMTTFG